MNRPTIAHGPTGIVHRLTRSGGGFEKVPLELLDPIRFQMKTDMDPKDRANLAEVRIRRLKDEINRQSIRPPFAEQLPPVELKLGLSPQESALHTALREYRKRGQAALGHASAAERWLGQFIYSLLTKRLLSCPYAFARTWWRHLESGDESEDASLFDMARVSAERAEEQAKSDDERSLLEEDAARYSGAWFRSRGQTTEDLQRKVNEALEALGYDRKTVEDPGKLTALARKSDSKTEALVRWVKKNLFADGKLAGRRAADRLHRVQGDAVLPGAADAPGRVRQEHAAAALRRHEPRRVRGGQVRVRGPHRRRAAAPGDRRRLGRHQHAGVLPLDRPLRHPVVALEAPAAQRASVPPRPGPGRERALLPVRRGGGHELPLPRRPEGRAGPAGPRQRRADLRRRHPAALQGRENARPADQSARR